jgi:arylformamidase
MTMQAGSPQWLDAQYNNRARVPEALQHLQRWAADSALARQHLQATGQAVLDVPYMADPSLPAAAQTLDIFTPPAQATPPEGGWPVLVFIHGGYWRALDKADHSFIAPPWVNAVMGPGAVVVVPNYALCGALCPAVRVSTITAQMQQAVTWVHRCVAVHGGNPQRLTVTGHSAGGHVVGMLLSTGWADFGLPEKPVQHGVSISGLFDLEPIRQTPFLADLGLAPDEARAQSPVHRPHTGGVLTAVVGGDESEEFLRQNKLLQQVWGSAAAPVAEVLPGLNHFSVVEELVKPGSRLAVLLAGG